MSDEQHPEIVDIGLPAVPPPVPEWILEQCLSGLCKLNDAAVRSAVKELLALRESTTNQAAEIARLRGEVGYAATME